MPKKRKPRDIHNYHSRKEALEFIDFLRDKVMESGDNILHKITVHRWTWTPEEGEQ